MNQSNNNSFAVPGIINIFQAYFRNYNILPMKINSLKFNEITAIVNNKELNLDLFDKNDRLFQEDACKATFKTTRNIDRYKFSKIKQKSRSKIVDESHMHRAKCNSKDHRPTEDVIYYLQQSLLNYMQCITSQQKKSIRKEMQIFYSILNQDNVRIMFDHLDQMELNLSKKIRNRIMHLIFYLVYNQIKGYGSDRSIDRQIRNYIFCEYYSRKFNFKKLTLSICIELQDMYCKINNYEMSRHYARKALRLSVVINNVYYEAKMVESLYILNYYEGRLNENTSKLLSKQQKKRILENYSEQQECPNIFQLEHLSKGQLKQFNLQHHNNFIQNSIPNENIKYFQTNYHDIIKTIPGKNINVRNIMSKVSSVGIIKKYFSKDNYITLKPECHIIKPIYQEQVLVTHKKDTNFTEKSVSWRKMVKRIRKMLDYTISSYTYQL